MITTEQQLKGEKCVKVSQEVVNGPIKSTRMDTPPELAKATQDHGQGTSTRHWVAQAMSKKAVAAVC